MTAMTETEPATPADLAQSALQLGSALGLHGGALGAALLSWADESAACFAIKDLASGQYVYLNGAMAELVGRSREQAVGQTDTALFGGEVATVLRAAELSALGQSTPHQASHRIERDRRRREFNAMRILLPNAAGVEGGFVASIWTETTGDAQREARLNKALVQLEQQQVAIEALRRETEDPSLRESLTGLYQRAHFDDQLRREVDLSSREHREFALVSIELDPPADDIRALGDAAHTRVLEALGRLLRGNTRAMDASCRLDADRFAVLLSGVGLATAHSRMEGLRRQCATQIVVLDGREFGFTASMGVASFPHTAHSQDELVAASEHALQEAKRRGGNHVALASIRFEL